MLIDANWWRELPKEGFQELPLNKGLEDFRDLESKGCAHCRWPPNWGGLPNGLRRRKFWSSEIPVFRYFWRNRRNTNFLRGTLKNPSVESVAGDHTQLSPKDFLLSFTRVRFLPGITYVLADVMCRFRTRSQMFACGGLAVAWEWIERTCGVLGLWSCAVILWFHGMIWWYDHII